MAAVELKDTATGELYQIYPHQVSLIAENGRDTCRIMLHDGSQLIVEGASVEVLKQISRGSHEAGQAIGGHRTCSPTAN